MSNVLLGNYSIKIGSGSTPRGGANVYLDKGNISLIRSQNIHNDGFKSNGLVYISDDAAKKLDGVTVEEKDILLNITGDSVARVCLAPQWVLPARVNQHVAIIRVKANDFDTRYVRYYLSSPVIQDYLLGLAASGATRNALTKVMIEKLELPKPELSVQKRIADILSSLDDKIALNREMNKTLESMAQAIFKSWFVDFEPFRDGEFVESELGMIPKGWEVKSLSHDFDITMGQSPDGKTYNEDGEGIPFFQGRTDFGFRFPSNRIYCTDPKRYAKKLDTLVSVRAPVGDMNIALEDCCIGRGLSAVRHKKSFYSFTYYLLNSIKSDFEKFEHNGTVFGSINKTQFENLKVIIPVESVIIEFEKIVNSIDEQIYNLSSEIQSLSTLRDTLLPKLLSGEIEV